MKAKMKTQTKISKDQYSLKYISMLKKAKTNKTLTAIINKIYGDGFEDGCNS